MANDILGKVWALDTAAGLVTTGQICIGSIYVRFTTAAAGSFQMTTDLNGDGTGGRKIIDLTTTATSTANAFDLSKLIPLYSQTFRGLRKTLCVGVDTIMVYTANPV